MARVPTALALRKLELATCGRPYGAPCEQERAGIRCHMLRADQLNGPG
jgi:hypothetical protein